MNTQTYGQRRRAKLIAEGRCIRCLQPQTPGREGKCLCQGCNKMNTRAARARLGCKPWRKGKPGRPPLKHVKV